MTKIWNLLKESSVVKRVISKIRAKLGRVIIGDTADQNSAVCIPMIHSSYDLSIIFIKLNNQSRLTKLNSTGPIITLPSRQKITALNINFILFSVTRPPFGSNPIHPPQTLCPLPVDLLTLLRCRGVC